MELNLDILCVILILLLCYVIRAGLDCDVM
jgi:hypothetical protein